MKPYILALDQGTTSSRAILFKGHMPVAQAQQEFRQIYPKPGWVEHDPEDIYRSQFAVMHRVIADSGIDAHEIAAIGLTNQRETTLVWERATGRPVYNAIVWQCRRTAAMCEELRTTVGEAYIGTTTGLRPDAYFSATKLKWILDNTEDGYARAARGDLLFGTVDTWLIWHLTGGKVHATDYTNASRTMLFNIRTLQWDTALLEQLGIPACMLPEVYPSGHIYGHARIGGVKIPIAAVAGDQQSALFGQLCFERGDVKNTYGTGCFLLMNIGDRFRRSEHGMLTTLAAGLSEHPQYVMEGSVFSAGSVIQWLRDEMQLIRTADESEALAASIPDNGGVCIVPAFTGLGAPYWDMYARGTVTGLTRGTGRAHLVRAALESIAFQSWDVVSALSSETGLPITTLRVDGGASANDFLMQFQADILGCDVERPPVRETTALGAAYLAGLTVGLWNTPDELRADRALSRVFTPRIGLSDRAALLDQWHAAVKKALNTQG